MPGNKRTQKPRFRLNPVARRWLRSPALDAAPDDPGGDGDWDTWFIGRLSARALHLVDGIYVDRMVLQQRFQCVAEQCAPGPGRGRFRSCCADEDVLLCPSEVRQIRKETRRLGPWLARREPRLRALIAADEPRPFWLSDTESHLTRPGGRCVFSALGSRGRIRCRLHRYAREHGLKRHQVQPLPCRLFPLVLLDLADGRVCLTTIYRRTSRLLGTFPSTRFPCLSDPSHPLLVCSAQKDLDWLFGRGFARTLLRLAEPV